MISRITRVRKPDELLAREELVGTLKHNLERLNLEKPVLRQSIEDAVTAVYAETDSQVVCVEDIVTEGGSVLLKARPTQYFCQAESNLVLDKPVKIFGFDGVAKNTSLRSLLSTELKGGLPKLSDRRLANSLGVTVCFLAKNENNDCRIRMVHRTKSVGVFPSGVHPAMSCAVKWPSEFKKRETVDLMDFIRADVEEEMRQETGLEPGQYLNPVRLSICREFLRGGKPQLFLLSYTELTPRELNEARDNQAELNKRQRPEKVEVLSSSLLSSRDPSILRGSSLPSGLTHEGAACLYLVDRLSRVANPEDH